MRMYKKFIAEETALYEGWLEGRGTPSASVTGRAAHLLFYIGELRRVVHATSILSIIITVKEKEEKILSEFLRILEGGVPDTFTEHQPDKDLPF